MTKKQQKQLTIMKPEEALEKLNNLVKETGSKNYLDLEKSHIKADKILIVLIQALLEEKNQKKLGIKINKAFYKIKKWYT